MKLGSTCRDCIFFDINKNPEERCKFNLLDIFKRECSVSLDQEGYPAILDKVCMYRRYPNWLSKYGHLSHEDQYKQLRKELRVRINVVVVDHNNIKDTEYTLSTLNNVDKVIVVHKQNLDYTSNIYSFVKDYDRFHIINLTDDKNPFDWGFRWAVNGYVMKINAGIPFNELFSEHIDYLLHEQLKTVNIINGIDDRNNFFTVMAPMYKIMTESEIRELYPTTIFEWPNDIISKNQ